MEGNRKRKTTREFTSFPELLFHTSEQRAHKTAIIALNPQGLEKNRISYRELLNHVSWYAIYLSQKYQKGDRCLIMIPAGIEFVIGYLACLSAGIIAVPVNQLHRNKKNLKFRSILKDAKASCIMVDKANANLLIQYFKDDDQISSLDKIWIKHFKSFGDQYAFEPQVKADDIAFLQYTSGSTGTPRGVMVSQLNLIRNSEVITQAFKHTHELKLLTWLPAYHDMGLVGNLLQPLYTGGTSIIFQPADFIKDPSIWLKAISRFKVTTTGGPNFAFDYCRRRIPDKEKKDIDLSSLQVLYCGSEPIRKKTFDSFIQAFKQCKLNPEMLLPCYGLAENTLMATGISADEPPRYLRVEKESLENSGIIKVKENGYDSLELVSCGRAWRNDEIVILDRDSGQNLPPDVVGEVLIKGDSVCRGYWNKPRESKETFGIYINNGRQGPYLNTGDLGFLHNDQLYITGRSKDLIIIRGINHYPQHLEESTENCHEALQPNACAAFSVEVAGEEKLVIVQEVKRTYIKDLDKDEIITSICNTIANEHEIAVFAIELISPGSIPKTSSGKIKRSECRRLWNNNELKSLAFWMAPQEENISKPEIDDFSIAGLRTWLISWLSAKSNIPQEKIDPSKPIMSYGLDSIGMVELEREVKQKFGIKISLSDFLLNNNINHLSELGFRDAINDDDDDDELNN